MVLLTMICLHLPETWFHPRRLPRWKTKEQQQRREGEFRWTENSKAEEEEVVLADLFWELSKEPRLLRELPSSSSFYGHYPVLLLLTTYLHEQRMDSYQIFEKGRQNTHGEQWRMSNCFWNSVWPTQEPDSQNIAQVYFSFPFEMLNEEC